MQYEIITDSCCNLPESYIDQYQLHVLSFSFFVGEAEYRSYVKGEITDLTKFYTMMRNKEVITTSLVNSELFKKMASELLDQGKDVIYIGFSSGLSATFHGIQAIIDDLRAEYPDRKILIFDSLAASMGQGLMVYHAAKLREQGMGIDELYDWLQAERFHFSHWFTVDDLFFLKRGGRVSASTALVGSMLGIKPVLHMDNEGHLIPMDKVRGRKKSLDYLVDRMEETAINPAEQTIFISHGDCIEDAEYVKEQVKKRLGVKDILINCIDPVIGAHSGPGTVALFFLGTQR